MQQEADVYHHLKSIQDKFIPHCYGYVDFNGIFRALVLKPCGRPIEYVKQIHRCGVLHCDLNRRNIFIDNNGKIWITDFSHAIIVEAHNAYIQETNAEGTGRTGSFL